MNRALPSRLSSAVAGTCIADICLAGVCLAGICIAGICILWTSVASAAFYTVHPDGSGDFPTIQAAVDAVQDDDVIELTDGIFTGDGNLDVDYLGKAITIRSQSGNPELCIIECDGSGTDPHRGFVFRWPRRPPRSWRGSPSGTGTPRRPAERSS